MDPSIIKQLQIMSERVVNGLDTEANSYKESWGGRGGIGDADLVVFWKTAEQLKQIAKFCYENNIVMQPRAGGTALTDGTRPPSNQEDPRAKIILVSLNKSIELLEEDDCVRVGASVGPVQINEFLSDKNLEVRGGDIGAQESSQYAGMFVTNAGGNNVYSDGTIIDNVIGITGITAQGEEISHMFPLVKNNAGINFTKYFASLNMPVIIITELLVKIFPVRNQKNLALLGASDIKEVKKIKSYLKRNLPFLTSIEYMDKYCVELVGKHYPDITLPFSEIPNIVLQIEAASETKQEQVDLYELMLSVLMEAVEKKIINENYVVIAQDEEQRNSLRSLRHHITMAASDEAKLQGSFVKGFDIGVPNSSIEKTLDELLKTRIKYIPDSQPVIFGHILDNGLHYNLLIKKSTDAQEVDSFIKSIFKIIKNYKGSISAEHTIGRTYVKYFKDLYPENYRFMQNIKQLYDPKGLIAPGVGVENEIELEKK